MNIDGRNVLVLGGAGFVGLAISKALLPFRPACLIVAARRIERAQSAIEALRELVPEGGTRFLAAAGDVFARVEPQDGADAGGDTGRTDRQRLIDDVMRPLDEDIMGSSLLARLVTGRMAGLDGTAADIVIDCINTATAVSYRNLYAAAGELSLAARTADRTLAWQDDAEAVLSSLYLPQLVRHVQILYEAMHRAGTQAYLKIGTTGTGGMGFEIPYTHGEERPSRLLLSKAAIAGAQTALNFLMARSARGPRIVKEVKPAALIGWRHIGHGRIREHGREIPLYDAAFEDAVDVDDPAGLVPQGDFGAATGAFLEGVYIDTGENGVFSADEFTAITAPGQMEMVTPEEIAENVIRELTGANSGHDVVAALDGAVMGPSYRGGHLRQAARNLLVELEAEHGRSVAFEILGPPRLAKLLFEAELLRRAFGSLTAVRDAEPADMAKTAAHLLTRDAGLRQRMLSIGIAVLLPDGKRLLRGPKLKSDDAHHGWVDLTPANMTHWQERMKAIGQLIALEGSGDTSSSADRTQGASQLWRSTANEFDVGEVVGWVFSFEDQGRRQKA